jgi:hypothetical protein
MNLPPRLSAILTWLRAVWPGSESELVRQYNTAFRGREDILRDLAEYAKWNDSVPGEELERVEGRREMFRHITAMMRLDPYLVDEILEGDTLE